MNQPIAARCAPLSAPLVSAAADQDCCPVIELRQYITYPGGRDELITLFEREFIESQEKAGIRVLGQFRDINDPHRFTWLRGFSGMEGRKQALTDFYNGALWKTWRNDANATLYDNDDVLLLRPASPGAGFGFAAGASTTTPGFVVATIYHFKQDVSPQFVTSFDTVLGPLFERSGAQILGRLMTDKSVNTFPQLPVREDVNVFVWFARFSDRAAYDRYQTSLAQDGHWRDQLFSSLYKQLARPPETLMLQPTALSMIR